MTDLDTVAAVLSAHGHLAYRERRLLSLRYGVEGGRPYSAEAVADFLGISVGRVRQIETQALKAIAQSMRDNPVI